MTQAINVAKLRSFSSVFGVGGTGTVTFSYPAMDVSTDVWATTTDRCLDTSECIIVTFIAGTIPVGSVALSGGGQSSASASYTTGIHSTSDSGLLVITTTLFTPASVRVGINGFDL
jgi:hypothetical protein